LPERFLANKIVQPICHVRWSTYYLSGHDNMFLYFWNSHYYCSTEKCKGTQWHDEILSSCVCSITHYYLTCNSTSQYVPFKNYIAFPSMKPCKTYVMALKYLNNKQWVLRWHIETRKRQCTWSYG
jgi:hypothetical protein